MRGDGPPYIMIGRSIRYSEAALIQWMRSQQRFESLPRWYTVAAQFVAQSHSALLTYGLDNSLSREAACD
jgi:hypothetical protein